MTTITKDWVKQMLDPATIKTVYARVTYDDVCCPQRSASLQSLPANHSDATIGECDNCGKSLSFRAPAHQSVDELACSRACEEELGWIPEPTPWTPPLWQQQKSDKPKTCPDCGGKSTRGRGYSHKDDCIRIKRSNKPKECPDCGGPSTKGKGYSHRPGCSNTAAARAKKRYAEQQSAKDPCPDCGGPACGKGWTHKSTCPKLVTKPENGTLRKKARRRRGKKRLVHA